ncbi:FxLYD domain-containing protein [Natrinema thermotolerans]|uniref:FxLYD domain-containing protein n=1 Tax=Natrinema thermotolerans TaxID=121872 RepID=UPI0035301474
MEHEFKRGGTFPSVVGTLENISGEEISNISVNVDFLDEDDVLIGEGLATTTDLPDGRVWEFEASYTGDESYRIDDYELETDPRL